MDYRFIQIDGVKFSVPASMSDTQLGALAGQLLTFRRLDYTVCTEYKRYFNYLEQDNAQVRIGTARDVYDSVEQAKQARDEYNAQLAEKTPA